MKQIIIIFSILFASCQSSPTANPIADKDSSVKTSGTPSLASVTPGSMSSTGTELYVWFVDVEKKIKTRNPAFRKEFLQVDSLIKGLNQLQPQIKLEKVKLSGDTLYTEIKDSEYLGERIGSFGANAYIADVVINLTSIRNIHFVRIDFEDGSHASPGVWSKKDYNDFKELP